ncbi:MAG: hypothetical protein ABI883_05865 [Chthoniobacterales bacterium]
MKAAPIIACLSIFGFLTFVGAQEDEEEQLITGDQFPAGFGVARSSLSPDGRYGVLAPADLDQSEETKGENKLVEVKTGKVLAPIDAETGLLRMNHGGILPSRWSAAGSLLLWHVDGKWSPRALVLLRIDNGEVKWQRNLLKMAQQEILARTRKVAPQKYAAIKKRNSELDQDYYPDGFTVNVEVAGEEDAPLSLPLHLEVDLETDPNVVDPPPKIRLTSRLKAVVDAAGKLIVESFAGD